MAVVENPAAAPPAPLSPSTATKRKRPDDDDATMVNGSQVRVASAPSAAVLDAIEDIWAVLKSHDADTALLDRVSEFVPSAAGPDGPSAKRQRVDNKNPDAPSANSIGAKIADRSYTSLEEFEQDMQTAAVDLLASLSPKGKADGVNGTLKLDANRHLSARLAAMIKLGAHLVSCEKQKPRRTTVNGSSSTDETAQPNGVGAESQQLASLASSRTVLTLFGNAQGQKQLFSSLQLAQSEKQSGGFEQVYLPLKEERLPHGIFNTEIHPVANEDILPETKRGQTFRDLYAPPPTIGQLPPPKSSKHLHSRNDRLSWAADKRPQDSTKKAGYTYEKLPTGNWLGYGGVVEKHEPVSPEAKRKRRDRALSTGEAVMTPSAGAKEALAQAKEEALFRSAYSSFAPVKDNSAALISESEKNQVWWERHGRELFEYTEMSDGPYFIRDDDLDVDAEQEEAEFEKAVEEFEPATFEFPAPRDKALMEERETSEILAEISEMLETLHSFQRIRNSTLSANPQSSIGQNLLLNDLTGTPSTPSSAEHALHDTLRQQLALMVSILPPFAVAKLNGDQLADLNISRHVSLADTDFRGVMEEDQGSRVARQAALTAAMSGNPAGIRPAATTPAAYRPPVAMPTGPNSAPRMAAGTSYGTYQPNTMPRGSSFSRSALSGWQQQPGQQFSSTQRSGYSQAPGASPLQGPNRNRPAAANFPPRPVNGQSAGYVQRPPSASNYAAGAAGYGAGSPVPRTMTPQGYQAPTPQMARPDSSSHGAQSPAGPRPGSGYNAKGGTESPSKAPAQTAYPTPSASSAAVGQADGGSRPHTPASGGVSNPTAAVAAGANGTPRAA